MKAIAKSGGTGNHALRTAHASPPGTAADATSRWQGLNHKTDLRDNYLLPEQYHLCCYSELDADREGLGFHIEHVENKSQNPARTFDYANLAASAFSSKEGLLLAKAQVWEVFGGTPQASQAGQVLSTPRHSVRPCSPTAHASLLTCPRARSSRAARWPARQIGTARTTPSAYST